MALAAAEADGAQKLLLHDAARPLVAPEVIDAVVQALDTDAALTAAVPAVYTTALADDAKAIADVPDRNRLWQIQTPQGFHTDVLRNAYALREQYPPIPATDDCGVVRAFLPEIPVRLVEGDRRCIKLTYPEDMTILSAFLAKEN